MSMPYELNRAYWMRSAEIWRKLKPPERPSQEEMAIYEKHLKEILQIRRGKIKAVILGTTPEIRDLLARYKIFDVTLVDISPNMVRAMQELLKISKGREKVVIANWLKTGLPAHQYDVVFCDHGSAHIKYPQWPDFFKEQKKFLKKDGFVLHNIVTRPLVEAISVIDFVKIYKKTKSKFSRHDKFYYNYLCFLKFKDYKTKYNKRLGDVNKILKRFVSQKRITQKDFQKMKTPWEDAIVAIPPQRVVNEIFQKFFVLRALEYGTDHPIYTCHQIYFGQIKQLKKK